MQVMCYFLLVGKGPSLEITGFCIYISDFSVLCIHILIQVTKERVVLQYIYNLNLDASAGLVTSKSNTLQLLVTLIKK